MAKSPTSLAIQEIGTAIVKAATGRFGTNFDSVMQEWAAEMGQDNGPGIDLHAYRNAVLTLRKTLGRLVSSLEDGIAEYEAPEEMDTESCPGCGCQPGDGTTDGCTHPDGCGFYLEVGNGPDAAAHDLLMAGAK